MSAPLDVDQLAVRDLARDVDPLDMVAHLVSRGFKVIWPCAKCGGTGTMVCAKPCIAEGLHECERPCDDPRCDTARHLLLMASIETDRIRNEEQGR